MSLKIMIVDDKPANLQLLRSVAAPLDHTVLAFQDTQGASQRAEKQRFDVIFLGRSLNISESGMPLQPSLDVLHGQEVSLEFNIPEVRAALHLGARVVRKEADRVGVEFLKLPPENINAIQLYVMGRLNPPAPPREKTFGRPPFGSA